MGRTGRAWLLLLKNGVVGGSRVKIMMSAAVVVM
jgi:hypothetical protein